MLSFKEVEGLVGCKPMRDRNPWTMWIVVVVAVSATAIGIHNFEWFLNVTCLVDTMPTTSRHCKHLR